MYASMADMGRALMSSVKSLKRFDRLSSSFIYSTFKTAQKKSAIKLECGSKRSRCFTKDYCNIHQKRHFFSSRFEQFSEKGLKLSKDDKALAYKNKKVQDWNVDDVAYWAKNELGFIEKNVGILVKQEIKGSSLLAMPNLEIFISVFQSYGLPGGPASDLWAAIQKKLKTEQAVVDIDLSILVGEWKKLGSEFPTDLISRFGYKMPVVQRSKEISIAWNELKTHYCGWKTHETDRKNHPRCFAYGPPGSGKTKFGIELLSLLRTCGQQLVDNNNATDEDKEILKLLSNAIFIHITFANGNALLSHETERIETALVVRGIRSLFCLNEMKMSMFYSQFGEKIMNWNLDTLIKITQQYFCSDSSAPTMIYLHLDEFNHLYNTDPKIFKQVVDILSSPLCTALPGVFYHVLFTGTAYSEMMKLGVSESYPLIELPMQILDTQGIMEVVSTMHKNGHLPWIDDCWEENKPFILCLLKTGGLPRALEYILEEIDMRVKAFGDRLNRMTIQDLEAVSNSAETRLLYRYKAAFFKSRAVYSEALGLGILGEPINKLNEQLKLDKSETYASLLSSGSILLKSINKGSWIIQLPIIWLNNYMQQVNDNSVVISKEVYEELTSIKPATWSQWERMTANMLMLRTNAIKLLGRDEFRFGDLFPGAKGSIDIMDREFDTYKQFYKRRDFPKQFLKNAKNTLQEDGAAGLFLPGTVWLNGLRGPGFDLWTVFKNEKHSVVLTKSYTITFVQCKFSSTNEPLKTSDIIKHYNELQEMWNNILAELNTNQLKGTNIRLVDFDFVFVIVSNRTILENHKTNDEVNQKSLSKCIIYDNSNVNAFFSTFSTYVVQCLKQ